MEKSHSASYAAAGVNIEAGYEGVRLKHRGKLDVHTALTDSK